MATCIVALTGASGAAYGIRLIEELVRRGIDVELIISPAGFLILKEELGLDIKGKDVARAVKNHIREKAGRRPSQKTKEKAPEEGAIRFTPHDDLYSALASGSSISRNMVICPSSMGTLARIASGSSTNLIERAADCVLKEKGTLVLVPRETPLNAIHLENMLTLSRAGAVILPAMPAFYNRPETIEDMVSFVVGKVLDILRIENSLYKRWKKQGF